MKILHISTRDTGGAAKACIRLHLGLLEQGVDSKLLLLSKSDMALKETYQYRRTKRGLFGRVVAKGKNILRKFYLIPGSKKYHKLKFQQSRPQGFELFSFPDTPFDITTDPHYRDADIVHLHWVARFLDYPSFFKDNKKKIVWTLQDMNPFTGGCHYDGRGGEFEKECVHCHLLTGSSAPRYAHFIWETKKKSLDRKSFAVVAPSHWLLQQSLKSSLFKSFPHHKIPYGLDAGVFTPSDQEIARASFGLPAGKKVLLFVSESLDNKRKGLELLLSAFAALPDQDKVVLCAVGGSKHKVPDVIELGPIADESRMSMAYSAATVFVIPSLEDNLPNTVLEALMCGTPVVGFPVGGIVDMIENGSNGFVCEEVSSESLARTIQKALGVKFDRQEIRNRARIRYDSPVQTQAYLSLYNEILNQ